jgi:hypothetical protein
MRVIAHAACSAISGSGSAAALSSAADPRGSDIPQRDADIPQQTAPLNALDRRPAKQGAELLVVEREIIAQLQRSGGWSGGERSLAGRRGEAVPRADVETRVAAVDAVTDQRPELERDRTFQLNREVGNAAPRIEVVRIRDRARRASGDATRARAAARGLRLVWRKRERRQDLAEKEPGAELRIDQHRALAVPADTRFRAKSRSRIGPVST